MTNIRDYIYFNVDLIINDLLKVTDVVCLKVWKWIKERSSYMIWLERKLSNMFKFVLNIRDISVPNNHLVVNPTHILIYSAICVLIMRRMLCILKSISICYCLLYQQSPVPNFVPENCTLDVSRTWIHNSDYAFDPQLIFALWHFFTFSYLPGSPPHRTNSWVKHLTSIPINTTF